jgi:hypothetical protein
VPDHATPRLPTMRPASTLVASSRSSSSRRACARTDRASRPGKPTLVGRDVCQVGQQLFVRRLGLEITFQYVRPAGPCAPAIPSSPTSSPTSAPPRACCAHRRLPALLPLPETPACNSDSIKSSCRTSTRSNYHASWRPFFWNQIRPSENRAYPPYLNGTSTVPVRSKFDVSR